MLRIVINFKKLGQSAMRMHTLSSFRFSTQKKPQSDKQERQKELQYRKRMMQSAEIKAINDHIENTRQNFNPLTAYFRLYRKQLKISAAIAAVLFGMAVFYSMTGVSEDPFSGKKKFMLISQEYERSLNGNLKEIMLPQMNYTVNSDYLSRRCRQLEAFLTETTKRAYNLEVVQCQDQVITVLPKTILISKNLFYSNRFSGEDLRNAVVLMESLFAKRLHIKELSISNISTFLTVKIASQPHQDIIFTKIYSRVYSQLQIESTLKDMAEKYRMSGEAILESVRKMVQSTNELSLPFALGRRFKEIIQ